MKIGFVLDDTLDSTDGVQQYVLTLANWLSLEGNEIHYLVGESTRSDLPNLYSLSRNVRVRFNGNRMTIPLPANVHQITQLLEREHYDVLHVQVPYSPLMAGRVINAAPEHTAVVGTFHVAPHSKLVRHATNALALISRRSLMRFDAMLSVSAAARDFADDTYDLDSIVLPNVIDVSRFAAAAPFPLDGSGPVIVYLGRLVPRKGCMVLLQAIRQLHEQDPTCKPRVIICGKGPLHAELYAFVARHGLIDLVHFAGYVSETDKARYLKAADIAVFPSIGGESFGIVLLEAMAANHPVVLGAANEGYTSVLESNPSSLFPVSDPAALAGLIKKFLHDESARRQTLQWQQSFVPRFDVKIVGPQLLEVYQKALASRNIP